ncbi:MAG: ATP-binding cassette domain-containing protein [Dehalococcoidia bacterium]|nr:ATP-binding cassette domain-containing protein [Dehalococcoidia bacterium]
MLEVRSLHKRYGDVIALDGCDMQVPRGRVVGFLGPNGSGKTTTMRSIFGLIYPDGGEVFWHGEPVTAAERLRFGYMPEQRGLYPKMRIREQLIYFGRLHGMTKADAGAASDAWLARLDLAERSESNLEDLSHGNQQRVQLASALVHRPELVVLDEPFSGLDPLAVETLAEVVREEAERGAAVVFSSHQLELVEDICQDVAIINRGRMVLSGDLQELRDRSPVRFVEVATDGAPASSWVPAVDGVEVISEKEGAATIRIPAEMPVDRLLAEAMKAGHVRYFRFEPPDLTRLFLETVRQ